MKELPMNKDIFRRMLKNEIIAVGSIKYAIEERIKGLEKMLVDLDRV